MKRIISLAAATIAGGILAFKGAQGLMAATTCHIVGSYSVPACLDTSDLVSVLGILGAITGFWLVYTGRLARFFRRAS